MSRPSEGRKTDSGRRVLTKVATATDLAEGPEGVRRILRAVFRGGAVPVRAVFRGGAVPVREVARRCALPVPVVSAVRRELERRGLLARGRGIELTEAGAELVGDLGLSGRRRFQRPEYPEIPPDLASIVGRMEAFGEARPTVDRLLDQSHATAETAVRRALFLYENDALEGRSVIVLGDDDLTSLAIAVVAEALSLGAVDITVVEVDERLVDYIAASAERLTSKVRAVHHDLRQPLTGDLLGKADVFFTDPPYTQEGLELFCSRGIEALRPEVGMQGYICFGPRTPEGSASAIGAMAEMGLAPVEVIPEFNRYDGAQMLAGVSVMIRTVAGPDLRPIVQGSYDGPLYTADSKRSRQS